MTYQPRLLVDEYNYQTDFFASPKKYIAFDKLFQFAFGSILVSYAIPIL